MEAVRITAAMLGALSLVTLFFALWALHRDLTCQFDPRRSVRVAGLATLGLLAAVALA